MRRHSGKRQALRVEVSHEGFITATRALIRQKGFDPTWGLFSKTFGWFQLQKKLSQEAQAKIESIWRGFDADENWERLAPEASAQVEAL